MRWRKRRLRTAATTLGLELFAPNSPSSSVTAIKAPAGMDSGEIVKGFRNQFGSIIANGQGTMKGQIFRIAHLGYFDDFEATSMRLHRGWYDTQDMGYMDADGYLWHVGRLRRFLKIAGEMVSLVKVEDVLSALLKQV